MSELDAFIRLLAKLPGLGPRSARRAALQLIKRRESLLEPLAAALAKAAEAIRTCSVCGNVDTTEPCAICRDPERDAATVCVVEDVADLWALERTSAYRGRYHVLGGTLSALDGVGPDDLNIERLLARLRPGQEMILALNATVDGQTTAHYLADRLAGREIKISRLAQGVPIGGELDYLDDGTLPPLSRRAARCRDQALVIFSTAPRRLTPGAAAEPDSFGKFRALLSVVRSDHRIICRKTPLCPVFFGRHVIGRPEMPLQHLQLLPVFKANEVIGRDRFADRHCGFERFRLRLRCLAFERPE